MRCSECVNTVLRWPTYHSKHTHVPYVLTRNIQTTPVWDLAQDTPCRFPLLEHYSHSLCACSNMWCCLGPAHALCSDHSGVHDLIIACHMWVLRSVYDEVITSLKVWVSISGCWVTVKLWKTCCFRKGCFLSKSTDPCTNLCSDSFWAQSYPYTGRLLK